MLLKPVFAHGQPSQTLAYRKMPAGMDYSTPTSDELSNLRTTEELFKSNLFKLQIEELLREVGLNYESYVLSFCFA